MTKKSTVIYGLSSVVYFTIILAYTTFSGELPWNIFLIYGFCMIVTALLVIIFSMNRETEVDRFHWHVYVLLPLIAPALLVALILYGIFNIMRFVFYGY